MTAHANGFAQAAPAAVRARGTIAVLPLRVTGWLRYGDRGMHVVNYTYLVSNPVTGESLIVDPGWELDTIEDAVRRTGGPLSAILLTHSHFDHVNLVAPLVRRYGADVWISGEEMRFYRFSCPNLRPIEVPEPWVVAGLEVVPYFTPGHSRGSTCFLAGDNLFTGDTLFSEGCGACVGDGADPRQMFESIQMLKARCPRHVRVFPAHSFGEPPGKSFDELLRCNVYLNMDEYQLFHAFRMRSNQQRLFDFK